ncbi:MAG: cation:proton antiporter [Candidatus Hadarchaeales archaeon]
MEFILALLVLLLYAKVLGELFHHYGFSSLIGEVITGIILGPAVLGWIVLSPNDATSSAIEGVALLGLLVMMLVSGMNSRFDLMGKIKWKALAIAVPAAILAFLLSFLASIGAGISLETSLFIAIVLSNTSIESVARITRGHHLEQILISSALIDDILAIYVIGVVSTIGLGKPFEPSTFLITTIEIIAFFLVVTWVSRELVIKRNLMKFVWMKEERGVPVAFAICLALGLAVIAHKIGLHMIIGAYMAGLFISRLRERPMITLQSRVRLNKILEDVGLSLESVLTPVFFAYVGLQLAPDWGKINFVLFGGVLLAALAGKYLGGSLGAGLAGLREDRSKIGIAMCSRGALELALIHFGLQAGLISQEIFSTLVFTVIITAVLTPVLFGLMKREK